jgi:hypothetical protein
VYDNRWALPEGGIKHDTFSFIIFYRDTHCVPDGYLTGIMLKKVNEYHMSVIRKVKRLGGENGQFRHNRASNA